MGSSWRLTGVWIHVQQVPHQGFGTSARGQRELDIRDPNQERSVARGSADQAAEAITNQTPPLGLRRATRRLSARAAAAQGGRGRVATWYKASVVSSWSKAKREAVGACRRNTFTRTPKVATKERAWQGERFRRRPLEEGGVQGPYGWATGKVSELVESVIGASSASQARANFPRSGRRETCSALAACWVEGKP